MNAVITKKQKNTILVLGAIAALFGAVSGASGLLLREKYLVFEGQDWDVAAISGFTKGYFGVMSGFIVSSVRHSMSGMSVINVSFMLNLMHTYFIDFSCFYLVLLAMVSSFPESRAW